MFTKKKVLELVSIPTKVYITLRIDLGGHNSKVKSKLHYFSVTKSVTGCHKGD